MTEITRRTLLRGALSLMVASAIPASELIARVSIPTLYGDGVHDDTVALQALLSGEPVNVEGEIVTNAPGQRIYLRGGTYRIGQPIKIAQPATIVGVTVVAASELRGPMFQCNSATEVWIERCTFTGIRKNDSAIYIAAPA